MRLPDLDLLALIADEDNGSDQWRIIRPYHRLGQVGMRTRWSAGDHAGSILTDPASTVLVVARKAAESIAAADAWFAEHRPRVRAIVYECDDLLFDVEALDFLESARFMRGMSREYVEHQIDMARYFAVQCDGMTVSSELLAEVARLFTDKPVIVLPNALDVRWFRAQLAPRAPWADDGIITIGWAGSVRPRADLEPMIEAWARIAQRYSHVRFVVSTFGQSRFLFAPVEQRTTFVDWREWDQYPMAYQVDIGCCTVADTPFSRAKTPIKAWEYAAAGAAVVATPTLYGDCVDYMGYRAQSVGEWEMALSLLVEASAETRQAYVRAGRAHVKQFHALDTQAKLWPEAYAAILARQPSGVP